MVSGVSCFCAGHYLGGEVVSEGVATDVPGNSRLLDDNPDRFLDAVRQQVVALDDAGAWVDTGPHPSQRLETDKTTWEQ